MGRIHEGAERCLAKDAVLPDIVRPFLFDFDVSWGAAENVFGSEFFAFFLKPGQHIRERFGVERELLLIYARYPTVEPRILQAAAELMSRTPARGRVEPLM